MDESAAMVCDGGVWRETTSLRGMLWRLGAVDFIVLFVQTDDVIGERRIRLHELEELLSELAREHGDGQFFEPRIARNVGYVGPRLGSW